MHLLADAVEFCASLAHLFGGGAGHVTLDLDEALARQRERGTAPRARLQLGHRSGPHLARHLGARVRAAARRERIGLAKPAEPRRAVRAHDASPEFSTFSK